MLCDEIESDWDGLIFDGFPIVESDSEPDCVDLDDDNDGDPDETDCDDTDGAEYTGAEEISDGDDDN